MVNPSKDALDDTHLNYIVNKREQTTDQPINISPNLLEKISTLHLQNNSKIIMTKRGKNNPHHMFIKPSNTRDPSKQKLERVYTNPKMPESSVAIGTYDICKYQSIGSAEVDDKLLQKIKNTEYDLVKMEDRNLEWIERARKDYMSKIAKGEGKPENVK